MEKRMLVVDDDAIERAIIANIFSPTWQVDEVADGRAALEALMMPGASYSAVLLDYMMPVMDGLGLLEALAPLDFCSHTPVFIITAEADAPITKRAYGLGVMDVIPKPVVPYIVRRRVGSVVELYEKRRMLEHTVEEQAGEILEQAKQIIRLNYGLIEAISTAIEFRSGESGAHVRRIHDITLFFLEEAGFVSGLTSEEAHQVALASIMHDVGKIAISDSILNKPGRLSAEEFEIMKTHTTKGAQLLERIVELRKHPAYSYAHDIALHHHERWDGRGYPEGLSGDALTPFSQVVALADVYDALCGKRCYKEAFSPDVATDMIRTGQCGTFNPALVGLFLKKEGDLRAWLGKEGPDGQEQA